MKIKSSIGIGSKERSENIMITDLVRNDLSIRLKRLIEVTELCGIYSFMQVHQMISTVTSKLDPQYMLLMP
jgi:para-aminobenzoate synthetase component 1